MSAEESGKSAELRFTRDMFRAAVFDDIGSEDIGYTNYSYWRSTIRTFFKSMVVRVMVVIVIAIILMSFIYPILSKTDPRALTTNTAEWNLRPSADHWFGTDTIGRDIWARAWYGTRNSFLLAFVIACSDIGLGAIMGALWGYSKKADVVMVEVYNVITNVPSTVYLVLLAYIMGTSYLTLFISMASRGWIVEARFFRNRILSIRDNEYNIASKCLGTPVRRIATKNIIPHIISLIIMETALCVPYSISSEVFLSFIGVGMPVDAITLGNIVNHGRSSFTMHPYQMLLPTIILCMVTISFYIIGNKFADASDPKNHI
ncbi:MAG TPA: ABC transporter permease [Bacillota bacterium]|jgi:oligopeptide transport system permease protein|nr:ABC transporter permease [Fastidiosipila sp.]HPX93599.1 ABC transporter permease [Bacillota bacterium]HQB80575.1 ABC transporter permease [Bacillota bacterium]